MCNSISFSFVIFELCGFALSICSLNLIDRETPGILSDELLSWGSIWFTKYSDVNVVFFGNTFIRTTPDIEKAVKNLKTRYSEVKVDINWETADKVEESDK